tara:strand:+ start:1702 stop:2370 length:669 start_codon:yes stop_codon:yes gene_type:complete
MNIKKKILKNIFIQNILAFIAASYIFFVKITSQCKFENFSIPSKYWKNQQPFILAFWHGQLMTISFAWKIKKRINILASGHSDGRFGAIVGNYFNLKNIPTSNINKKVSLIPIFKILKTNNYIGITPDGPRGPKEKASEGIIKIAKISKIPIIPIGFWSSRNFHLRSWDSFLVTKPFSKCSFVWGKAIRIPENVNEDEIKNYQTILENRINECIAKAKKNTV